MEVSGILILCQDFVNNRSKYYKNLVFAKFDNKVYIQISECVSWSVIIKYDDLMKNECLKTYYELSLAAIGKPNIDEEYYCKVNPNYVPTKYEKNNEMFGKSIRELFLRQHVEVHCRLR
jgi:hypothetical protein